MPSPRTNSEAVRAIMETDPEVSLVGFIRTAHVLTNQLATYDTANNSPVLLDVAALTEIESYLAAHFYSYRDQLLTSKSTNKTGGSFQGQTAMALNYSPYGQAAMLLDLTGFLAQRSAESQAGGKRKVRANWIGNPDDSPRPDEWGEGS